LAIKYLDAKRIRGTADPYTFTDAFTSDSAWTKVGTKWSVDTGDGRVENIAYSSYAPNDYVYHDMGSTFNAMSQSFILRFRCHHSQGSNYGYVEVGFTDSTSDADGGDMINASLNKGGGNPYLRINESIDGTMAETATGGTSASLATCYIELIFDASTRIITQKAYSDSGYSSKISAGTDPTGTFTTGEISSMTGMRYLFIGSVTASGRGLDANCWVDDIRVYKSMTSITADKATLITTYADSLGSAVDATNNGATADSATAINGKASLTFDDSNDWISLGTGLNSSIDGNAFSISLWAYVSATNINDKTIIGKQIAGYSSPYHVFNFVFPHTTLKPVCLIGICFFKDCIFRKITIIGRTVCNTCCCVIKRIIC